MAKQCPGCGLYCQKHYPCLRCMTIRCENCFNPETKDCMNCDLQAMAPPPSGQRRGQGATPGGDD